MDACFGCNKQCNEDCTIFIDPLPNRKRKKQNNAGVNLKHLIVFDEVQVGERVKFRIPAGRVCCIKTQKGIKIIKILRTKTQKKSQIPTEREHQEVLLPENISTMEIENGDWKEILSSLQEDSKTQKKVSSTAWKKELLALLGA